MMHCILQLITLSMYVQIASYYENNLHKNIINYIIVMNSEFQKDILQCSCMFAVTKT